MSTRSKLAANKDKTRLSPVCTNCREKHLKCSGAPLCLRCKNQGAKCTFVPSRRGMRPSKGRARTLQPQPSGSSSSSQWTGSTSNLTVHTPANFVANQGAANSPPSPAGLLHVEGQQNTQLQPVASDSLSMSLINNSYEKFLPLHPFALPKNLLVENFNRPEVQYLRAVIEYIGSFYVSKFNRATYADYAERLFFSDNYPQNAYTVQAFLLLAIKLSADGEYSKSIQLLQRSRNCALQIGMNRYDFAQLHSGGSSQQETSWQATWVTLNQMCAAWSPPPEPSMHDYFPTRPLSLPAGPSPSLSNQYSQQRPAGRRSSATHHILSQTQSTQWKSSTSSIQSMALPTSHAADDYFSNIHAFDSTAPPIMPQSEWILGGQTEEEESKQPSKRYPT